MSFVRIKPYALILCCFCMQLFLIAWSQGVALPLVGMGYTALMLLVSEVSWLLHGYTLFFIALAALVQGFSVSFNLFLWIIIAILIAQYRHVLHDNFIVYAGIVGIIAVFAMLLQGGFDWTIWNILGMLIMIPSMVTACV